MPGFADAETAQVLEEVVGPNPFMGMRKGRMDKGVAWTARQRAEKQEMLENMNRIQPVVIVNFNPFMLRVNGGMLFKDGVAACPIGQEYQAQVMRHVRWMTADKGVGFDNIEQFDPVPYVPAQLATEYIREYTQERQIGGVLIFMGETVPLDRDVEVTVPIQNVDGEGGKYISSIRRNLKDYWEETLAIQNETILSKIEKANRDHQDPNRRLWVNYTEIADYARLAKARGILAQKDMPEWVLNRDPIDTVKPDACPICKAETRAGAVICITCGQHVFDVVEAYRTGAIEYGHFAVQNAPDEDFDLINQIKAQRDELAARRKPRKGQS